MERIRFAPPRFEFMLKESNPPSLLIMSDDFPQSKLLRALKGQVDELLVQLNLGKREAIDYVEDHKEQLRGLVDRARGSLESGETTRHLRQKLDELRLQLALGRMESRDALQDQRGKIQGAIEEVRHEWEPIEADLRETLESSSDALKTKLDALALDLGIGKIVAEEKLGLEKDRIRFELEQLRHKIQPALEETGDALEHLGREAKSTFDDIRRSLRGLFD